MQARHRRRLAVGIVCLAIIGVGAPTGSAGSMSQADSQRGVSASRADLAVAIGPGIYIRRARAALARAESRFANHRYGRGLDALVTLRRTAGKAHRAAVDLIGKPPTDPESDEPPGPPAVIKVLGLERAISVRIAALFNGMTRAAVVDSLRRILGITHRRRDAMLDRVIALNPEGAGGDYDDGMADILPAFTSEVNKLQNGVDTYELTPSGREGLVRALRRAIATRDKVEQRFGGGE